MGKLAQTVVDRCETRWLIFGKLDFPDRKTDVWQVVSFKGIHLGDIKWFGRWHCYSLFVEPDTVFNSECLKDIREFINQLMAERVKN